MALWKPFRGSRSDLDSIPKHDGYVYFCDDGSLFFDYTDAAGVLQRKQINAKEAETLTGKTLDEIQKSINYNDLLNKPVLGDLSSKDTVSKSDLSSDVQTSLGKADSALQSYTETDPTVPSWAKASTKPSYTKSEVGLGNVDNVKQYSASNPPPYPVTKVNNKTGAVTLSASDVGADASGTASSTVANHNTNTLAHADIRGVINQLSSEKINVSAITQNTGDSQTAVMSQRAVTDEFVKRGQLKPEFANSVEELEESGDTTKLYVLPDGYIYAYMNKTSDGPSFTNLADPTSDEWLTGYRLNYQAKPATADAADKTAGAFVSNLFDCKKGDIIRIKGVTGSTKGMGTSAYFCFSGCDADGNNASNNQPALLINPPSGIVVSDTHWSRVENQVTVTEDGIYEYEIMRNQSGELISYSDNIVKGRIAGIATNGIENVIITVNEKIIVSSDNYQWVNTGHAFVPADYEDRIVALEEDVVDIQAQSLQQTPEFANSIAECADTTKLYVLPDGYVYAYMNKSGGEPLFTNLANIGSTEWQTGSRHKSDGSVGSADVADKTAGAFVSNLFDCKQGDIIRIKGVTGSLQGIGTSAYFIFSGCDADGNNATNKQAAYLINPPSGVAVSDTSWNRVANQVTVTEDGVYKYEILLGQSGLQMSYGSNIVKGRISGIPTDGAENIIITINEEIVYSSDGYQWANTGHAFVPADYEDRIVELENFVEEIEETIKEVVEESATALDYTAYGLPILYLTGDTLAMNKDTSVTLNYVYGERSGTCSVKWQGSSSLSYEKKNYTIKFDNAFEAHDGWGEQKKYCTKANYIDFSHARNLVSAKLWGQVVKSRTTANARLNALVNGGAVDGFPMLIVINGEYHGLYTFNIPKDGWMFGMGEGTNECILCANDHTAGTRFQTEALCDESDFEIEYIPDENNTQWAIDSVNNLINAVIASNGTDIDTVISQYVDIESAIDYLIFVLLLQGGDMYSKNYILSTFDGVKWIFSAYDMDSTYGLWWNGKSFNRFDGSPLISTWKTHALMKLLIEHKTEAVKARYKTLRETVMSDANVINEFANFITQIPKAVLDEDYKVWKGIPSTTTNNLSQIAMHYVLRAKHIDALIDAL